MSFSSSSSVQIWPQAKTFRINKSLLISSYQTSPPNKVSSLLRRLHFHQQWKSNISRHLSRFDLNRRSSLSSIVSDSILDRRKSEIQDNDDDDDDDLFSDFNNATYCFVYCSIIIIGVLLGGWIGGLFEFFITNHHACDDKHNGTYHCRMKYETTTIETICVNIFSNHIDSLSYLCLCRFQHRLNSKYRHCDFLNASIF